MRELYINKEKNKENEIINKLKEEKEYWKKCYSKILDAYFELHKYRKLYDEKLSETERN
jgi:hypothetical protein